MQLKVNNVAHDIVKYVVPTHKLNFGTKRRVVLIADLHGYFNNKKKRDALIEAIRLQKPHHIVIAGDHMNASTGRWGNDQVYNNFCEFIKELSKIAPVFLSQGNHDINAKGATQEEANNRFMDLANINPGRVFPIINGTARLDEFEIVGFTPEHSTMADLSTQAHGIARDKFVDEFNEKGPEIVGGENVIVEMVAHNPHLVGVGESDKDLGRAKKVRIFHNGHWHNGYVSSMETRKNPEKYMSGEGRTEKFMDLNHDGSVEKRYLGYGPVDELGRGITFVDDMSQEIYLQLRNEKDDGVQYYVNTALNEGKNVKKWERVDYDKASDDIADREDELHGVSVTGGVKKYSPIPLPDEPEVTVIDYEGRRRK